MIMKTMNYIINKNGHGRSLFTLRDRKGLDGNLHVQRDNHNSSHLHLPWG